LHHLIVLVPNYIPPSPYPVHQTRSPSNTWRKPVGTHPTHGPTKFNSYAHVSWCLISNPTSPESDPKFTKCLCSSCRDILFVQQKFQWLGFVMDLQPHSWWILKTWNQSGFALQQPELQYLNWPTNTEYAETFLGAWPQNLNSTRIRSKFANNAFAAAEETFYLRNQVSRNWVVMDLTQPHSWRILKSIRVCIAAT
jgi:hypothetical protein